VIVDFSLRAERQIDKARRWWLGNRDKAPEAFDEDLGQARELLSSTPYAGMPWRTRTGKYIRRLTLERIRYYMFYRVTTDRVEVIFFWHTSRRPPRL
jgi:plasmid stabilization system protein ParE